MTTIIHHDAKKQVVLKFRCNQCESEWESDEYYIDKFSFGRTMTCPICKSENVGDIYDFSKEKNVDKFTL